MKKFYSLGDLKTQICTTREQSERLIEFGLKRETADMCWTGEVLQKKGDIVFAFTPDEWEDDIQPRWSLHRLVSLCPYLIEYEEMQRKNDLTFHIHAFGVYYEDNMGTDFGFNIFDLKENLYDNMIDCIEWLIREGYINKEYLNK